MNFSQFQIVFVMLIVFQINSIYSQTDSLLESCSKGCCCLNDPTPAGIIISHIHNKNEWMLSYQYMNMGMNGILEGTKLVSQNDVFTNYLMASNGMRMDMHMLMGMYGIADRLTTMVMLNYNSNSMEMSMFPVSGQSMPGMVMNSPSMSSSMMTKGFGDIKLHFLYGLMKRENHRFLIAAGVSIPLGSIQQKGNSVDLIYPNERLPYAMQLGSGSLDILPCINYLYQKNDLTFSGQVSATIRSSVNTIGYKWGNEVVLNTWLAYNWINSFSSSCRLEGSVVGAINGRDHSLYIYNELSANPFNYGGQKLKGYVGSTYQFKEGFLKNNRLSVEYGIPMYQKLNGMQMKLTQSLFASWSYTF